MCTFATMGRFKMPAFFFLFTRKPATVFSNWTAMRRSPRRPLILRRKLPFHQNESAASKTKSLPATSGATEPPGPTASAALPDGIRILDHPSRSDTQVVVMLKSADLQSVIGALTVKGKECGAQGPNKFILLGGNDDGLPRQAADVGNDGRSISGLSAASPQVKTVPKHLADIKPCMFFTGGHNADFSTVLVN